MPQRFLASAALVAALVCVAALPASARTDHATGVSTYIVVLEDGANAETVASLHAARYGASVGHVYRYALKGYAAVIPNDRVAAVRLEENVAYVESDGVMTVVAQTIPYGIVKVGADVSPTAKAGDGQGAVSNTNAYIIDTGIDAGHQDLNVVRHVNFANGPNRDCHGHGTHVAGTVAANDNTVDVVGVSPGTPLTGVKVLSCSGSGSTSGVIAGVDWVTANAIRPAVANMSLGGGASSALDTAVRNSANSGVFYAVAAGNEAVDACTRSPARAGAGTNNGIATVAATDEGDFEASFSNFGSCVDIWAPGVRVLSTRKGGGTTTFSGTSMASPHVAGGGSVYLSNNTGASSSSVESALKSAAQTPGTSKDGRTITRLYIGGF